MDLGKPPVILEAGKPDIFALWEPTPEVVTAPGDMAEAFSFSTAEPSPRPGISTWQLDLPADLAAARTQLDGTERQVQATAVSLTTIPDRLDQLVQRGQAALTTAVSFSTTVDEAGLARPEADLLSGLAQLQAGDPELSFAVGGEGGTWENAKADFQTGLQRLLGLITHMARVETQVANQLLGCTIVGWTGNMHTAWGTGFGPDHLDLHRRSLALALASRQTLLRTLMIATQGAAKISALLAIPGGQILALPVAWKYVNQVLAEVDKYHEIKAKGA